MTFWLDTWTRYHAMTEQTMLVASVKSDVVNNAVFTTLVWKYLPVSLCPWNECLGSCGFNPHARALSEMCVIAAMVTHQPCPVIFLTSLLHSLPIIAPPALLLPSHISLAVEMFQRKRTLPLVLWRQAMGGSVRTGPCAGPGGKGPSMASPTSTTSPSPCWQCSSASPWRAGQMCCTGYADGAPSGWVRGGPEACCDISSSYPQRVTHAPANWGVVDEGLWFVPVLSWKTKL